MDSGGDKSQLDIRAALVSEIDHVLVLWREAEAERSHTDDVASITQLIKHDPEALIVAEVDGRIVGSVIAAWDGWRGSIYRLAVSPAWRRQGLGRQLVAAAESRLSGLGLQSACRRLSSRPTFRRHRSGASVVGRSRSNGCGSSEAEAARPACF